MPREMIAAYATLKKAAANANHAGKRLDDERHNLIVEVCDEILAGQHEDMFPLHVWMTGSGTQFNMNVNEVISNRCCQLAGTPLGGESPVHPNDHVITVLKRFFPHCDEHSGGSECEPASDTGGEGFARRHRNQSRAVGEHRQDRPDSHAGRHAFDARAGVVRLRGHAHRRS